MIRCPTCQTFNREGARFCVTCGETLAPVTSPPTAPLAPGVLLDGRYRINGPLGEGGLAAIYHAEDTRLSGQPRAVKQLREDGLSPDDRRMTARTMANEGHLLTTLNQPGIPRVYDFFEQDGRFYLVMELFTGQTLDDVIRQSQGKPFEEHEVVRWGSQLCDVLAHLHGLHPPIVLRDLKPANIVITPDGNVRLIDFGVARAFTPGHAPLEQSDGQTDARSDVYTLGALLHQLLTGRDPQQTACVFEPLRQVNPSASIQLEQTLLRALAASPNARFQTAQEMKHALTGERVPVAKSGAKPRPVKLPRSVGRRLMNGMLALMCLTAIGIGGTGLVAQFIATATPMSTLTSRPPTATRTPTPTPTSTPTRGPTSTPVSAATTAATPLVSSSPTRISGSVAGLRAELERLKGFLESASPEQFNCDAYLRSYDTIARYPCPACQRAIGLVRDRGANLSQDCRERGGTRSIDKNKIRQALSGVFDASGVLPP